MAARVFSLADNLAFAEVSGDHNPIHSDPAQARRSAFGAPIVHGVHALIWALDQTLPAGARLAGLKVQFPLPLRVDEPAICTLVSHTGDHFRIRIASGGRTTADIEATLAAPSDAPAPDLRLWPAILAPEPCRAASFADLTADTGTLALAAPRGGGLAADQLALLLGLTRLVGMRCPGLYSLFSALELSFTRAATPAASLTYRVERADPRYDRLKIAIDSGVASGALIVFRRPEPQRQPAAVQLAELVLDQPFAGQRAVIIGGSRGLGELTAKLLALGGADVRLSYHLGAADAQRVVEEIAAAGGRAQAFAYDAADPAALLPCDPAAPPTHLYYFATSFLALNDVGQFDRAVFRRHATLYVEGFSQVVQALLEQNPGPVAVFYPSTQYLDALSTRAIEYAVAKAAGESLCDHLAVAYPRLTLHRPRLPRLPTDLVQSFGPAPAIRAEAVMLEHLRALPAAARKSS